jgi:hypothetical protein
MDLPSVLMNGVATMSSSDLSHGVHLITAEYQGDGNFRGATNALASNEVIDIAPVALPASYGRSTNSALQIPITDLLTNHTSDADGDPLVLNSVGAGTNGATISISAGYVVYQPSATDPHRNSTDHFTYLVSDGFPGGLATNLITVTVNSPNPASLPPLLTGIVPVPNGIRVTFTAVAGVTYTIQRATVLGGAPNSWTSVGAAAADNSGAAQFTDTNPPPNQAFYRVAWP